MCTTDHVVTDLDVKTHFLVNFKLNLPFYLSLECDRTLKTTTKLAIEALNWKYKAGRLFIKRRSFSVPSVLAQGRGVSLELKRTVPHTTKQT